MPEQPEHAMWQVFLLIMGMLFALLFSGILFIVLLTRS